MAASTASSKSGEEGEQAQPVARSITGKMSISIMPRRGRSFAVNDDDAEQMVALMDTNNAGDDGSTEAGLAPAHSESQDSKTSNTEGAEQHASSVTAFTVNPVLEWKAAAMRALRSAPDGALTVTTLAALVPNPFSNTSYAGHLQEHLIDRLLARWVVVNESLQLIAAVPAAGEHQTTRKVSGTSHGAHQDDDGSQAGSKSGDSLESSSGNSSSSSSGSSSSSAVPAPPGAGQS